MKHNEERYISLDILRIVACFLVCLYHVPALYNYNLYLKGVNFTSFLLGRCAVPLFFVMSGWLLLPNKQETFDFFKKKAIRIVIPCIIWMLIYEYMFSCNSFSMISLWELHYCPHLWYLYALIGLYLLVPILSPWLERVNERVLNFYLLLWLVTLIFNGNTMNLSLEYDHQGFLFHKPPFILYYFYGYVGYFILGFKLKKLVSKFSVSESMIVSIICLVCGIIGKFVSIYVFDITEHDATSYLSVPTLLITLSMFLFIIKMDVNNKMLRSTIIELSGKTFGIYLVHWMIFVLVINNYFHCPQNRIFLSVMTFGASYVLIKILSLLPRKINKYIIG